jgi:ComEC/Rec2-related protein
LLRAPLVPLAIAFAAGVGAEPLLSPTFWWTAWFVAVGATLILVALDRRVPTAIAVVAAVVALGAIRGAPTPLAPHDVAGLALPRDALVEGRVTVDTRPDADRRRLVVDVVAVDGVPRSGKIQLTVYGAGIDVREGQRIRVTARLRRATGYRNPGGFDYAAFLARDGIRVLGTANARFVSVVDAATPWHVEIRRRALTSIETSLPPISAGLLGGLLLGARGGLPPDVLDGFRAAGVYHVLAVSGFNVALIAAAVFATALLVRASSRIAAITAIVVVCGFALVVGSEPSVLRAVIMAVVVLVALLLDRESSVVNGIALAAVGILAARPGDLHDPGFQLSFAATAGIVLAPIPRGLVAGAIAVSLAAQLAVLPITLAHFNQASIIGLVANLAVVPLAGFATVVGLAAIAVSAVSAIGAGALFDATWPALILMRAVVSFAAAVPGALVHLPAPHWTSIVAYTVGLASALIAWNARRDRPAVSRVAGACAFWLLLGATVVAAWPMIRPLDHRLRVVVLDVGRGQAVVAELPDGRVAVLLAGTRPDTADRVIAPYLWNRGVRRVDVTLATPDAGETVTALRRLFPPPHSAPGALEPLRVVNGASGSIGAVTLDYGRAAFVFALDPDAAGFDRHRQADVLTLAPATEEAGRRMLTLITPPAAILSVSARDREREGHLEALAPLVADHVTLFRTDRDGALVIDTDGRRIDITRWATGAVERLCLDPDSPC